MKHMGFCCCTVERKGEGNFASVSAKHWDSTNVTGLIELATPCHDGQMVGSNQISSPLRLTVLAAKSCDYTTAPQQLPAKDESSSVEVIANPNFQN